MQQVAKEILEHIKDIHHEHSIERFRKRIVDLSVLQIMGDEVEVARAIHLERTQQGLVEDIVDILAPQIQGQSVDVIKVIPKERCQYESWSGLWMCQFPKSWRRSLEFRGWSLLCERS